jgi:hypothetical protein
LSLSKSRKTLTMSSITLSSETRPTKPMWTRLSKVLSSLGAQLTLRGFRRVQRRGKLW